MTSQSRTPGHWQVLRIMGWGAAAFIMLVPLVAMQFDNTGVSWTPLDFIFMGGLIAICGAVAELSVRLLKNETARRIGVGIAFLMFVTIWAEAAVGIFH